MYKKESTKKEEPSKSKRSKTKAMESVFGLCEAKRCQHLLHVWKDSDGTWVTCRPFHTKISRGLKSVLQRRQCPRSMLQLQHKPRRKPVYLWTEVRRKESQRTIRTKTAKR